MSNIIELFKSVDPHRTLPENILTAMASACSLVLEKPADFVSAAKWLNEEYSEQVVTARLKRHHFDELVYRLRNLRQNGTGNFAWSTYTRRLRLQQASSDEERARFTEQLAQETITEARLRGIRLEAILLFPNASSYPTTYADGTAPSKRTSMVRWRYAARQNPDLVGHRIDEDNVNLVWQCEDERYRLLRAHVKTEWEDARRDTHERPTDRGWRFDQAKQATFATGLPAGGQEEFHARVVVLIGFLASYFKPLPHELGGEFFAWPWTVNGQEPGRNTVIFGHAWSQNQPNDYSEWSDYADLLARAANILKFNAQAQATPPLSLPAADPTISQIAFSQIAGCSTSTACRLAGAGTPMTVSEAEKYKKAANAGERAARPETDTAVERKLAKVESQPKNVSHANQRR